MTMLRMVASLVDESMGEQPFNVEVNTEVPPEAGPWSTPGYVADVFKHIIEGFAKADLRCDSISLFTDGGQVGEVLFDDIADRDAADVILNSLAVWDS